MDNYTIRPLEKLLRDPSKGAVKPGDIAQIQKKIAGQRNKKIAAGLSGKALATETAYLEILANITVHFAKNPKLTKEKIKTIINAYLRENNLYYYPVKHAIAHENTFYAKKHNKNFYDVAFYNAAVSEGSGHHRDKNGRGSIFYARFEEYQDLILIGNMQIDEIAQEVPWKGHKFGGILAKRKNLYLTMVQEAVKQGIRSGKKKIIFQGAKSLAHSQWNKLPGDIQLETVLINEANYEKYSKKYQECIENFDKIQEQVYKKGHNEPIFKLDDLLTAAVGQEREKIEKKYAVVTAKTPTRIGYHDMFPARPDRILLNSRRL